MIPESDKERLARALERECGPPWRGDIHDPAQRAHFRAVNTILTELTAMGYVVAKLEGRVNEQDRKPPEDAA